MGYGDQGASHQFCLLPLFLTAARSILHVGLRQTRSWASFVRFFVFFGGGGGGGGFVCFVCLFDCL